MRASFRRRLASLPVFVALVFGQGALAAESCSGAQDQAALNACAGAAHKAADAKLNATYGKILKRLGDDADSKARFTAAQRAWIAFRDAECAFQTSAVEGGSAAPMVKTGCLTALTSERVKRFEGYLACEEGDVSCPVPPGP